MSADHIEKIVGLLEAVAHGQLEPRVALEEWPDPEAERDRIIVSAWHNLSHYANDVDIRARDPVYQKHQATALLRDANKIRERYSVD